MKKELLVRPFRADQVKQRKGHHGQMLSYVDVAAVIERLNEAFEHEWSFEITQHEVQHGEVLVLGRLTAGGTTKCAFGGSSVTIDKVGDVLSIADDLKAASSDALKKAASMFGIALALYGGVRVPSGAPDHQPKVETAAPRRPLMPTERVTAKQLAALHALSRKTGMGKGDLEHFVERRVGAMSLNELSRADASRLISELTGNGNERHA